MESRDKITAEQAQSLPAHPDPSIEDKQIGWLGDHLRNCACRVCLATSPAEALGVFSPQAYSAFMAFLGDHGSRCRADRRRFAAD